jgi:pimeloyl-ACP methyl ester carboxylesterase
VDVTALIDIDTRDEMVIAGGLRFHYRSRGGMGAPAVLLLHGLTGNAWEWDPMAAVLSRRFHVIALNQRGHGASARAGDYAARRMVDDLARITAALGVNSLAIVGHSMGALNGFLFAARHPDLVNRLLIVDFGPDSMAQPSRASGSPHYVPRPRRPTRIPERRWPNGALPTPAPASGSCSTSSPTTSLRAEMAAGAGDSMPPASQASWSRFPTKQSSGLPFVVWRAQPLWSAASTAKC